MKMQAARLAESCERLFALDTVKLSESYYYASLPLCVIDAVFSIGVRYTGVQNTVRRYCRYFSLREYDPKRDISGDAYTVSELIKNIETIGVGPCADSVFQNHQRTSSRSGILKVDAVLRFAKILQQYGVETFADLRNNKLTTQAEHEIMAIPGQSSGLSLQYFYMLSGEDNLAKPDRHVLRFLEQYTGKKCSVTAAQELLSQAVKLLKAKYPNLTVRLLDYTIWDYMAHGAPKKIHTYNKLVRDRIPEIIETSGKTCVTEILSDEAYLKMLDKKLDEELTEYHQDQNIEELADLLEVIRATVLARGWTLDELEQVRADKAAKRGGFEKKILLKEVTTN
ncbi:MAG: nucleoside triphosphate pyrophosphohydrolase [Oscillospiraceae bacterium]